MNPEEQMSKWEGIKKTLILGFRALFKGLQPGNGPREKDGTTETTILYKAGLTVVLSLEKWTSKTTRH